MPVFGLGYEGEVLAVCLILYALFFCRQSVPARAGSFLLFSGSINLLHFAVALLWILSFSGDVEYLYPVARNFFSIFAAFAFVHGLSAQTTQVKNIFGVLLVAQVLVIYFNWYFFELVRPLLAFQHGEAYARLMSDYEGQRGFALSSSLAFGLATGLAFLSIFALLEELKLQRFSSLTLLLITLLVAPAMLTAGRINFLVIAVSFVLIFWKGRDRVNGLIFICLLALGVFYVLASALGIDFLESQRILVFVFEPLINLVNEGSFSTSSSDKLVDMVFIPDSDYWLVGSGRYFNSDGSYFMQTDSGYVRQTLMWGIPVVFLMLVSHVIHVFLAAGNRYGGAAVLLVAALGLIFHIKGDLVGYSVDYISAVSLVGFVMAYKYHARQ